MFGEWYEELEQDIILVVLLLSKEQVLFIVMLKVNIKDLFVVKDCKIKLIIVLLNEIGIFCYDVILLIVILKKFMVRLGMFIDVNFG